MSGSAGYKDRSRWLVVSGCLLLLAGLAFPPREVDFLDGIPVQGWHLALLIGLPLLVAWGIVLASKRDFQPEFRV